MHRTVTIEDVRIGKPRPVPGANYTTGIYKEPVAGPVRIDPFGVEGDTIIDTEHHGGADQAVYVYAVEDYDWWTAELGQAVGAGTFGENLTVSGIESADVCIGDRFTDGSIDLQVTAPRIPCDTLCARMDDRTFAKRFTQANRTGFYCRVLKGGSLSAGDTLEHVPFPGERVTVAESLRTYPYEGLDAATAARLLAVPLHHKGLARLKARYM